MSADLPPKPFAYEHFYEDSQVLVTVGFREVLGLMHIALHTNRSVSGYVGGLWVPEEGIVDFDSVVSENFYSPRKLGVKGIPRLIGATIRQIVTRGVVDNWHSSNTLRPEGKDLYKNYLSIQPDLDVRHLDNRKEFLVVRRTAN